MSIFRTLFWVLLAAGVFFIFLFIMGIETTSAKKSRGSNNFFKDFLKEFKKDFDKRFPEKEKCK